MKIASYTGLAIGVMVLVCGVVLLLFHDPLVNRFVKPRITAAFAGAYPAYSMRIAEMNYSILKNRFGFDSVAVNAVDGSFSSSVKSVSVSGIGWMHLLWGGALAPHDFDNALCDAQDIVVTFTQSQYELRCGRLHIAMADSEVVADTLELHPEVGDEVFFAESKFRRTRFNLAIRQCRMAGVSSAELLDRGDYHARSVRFRDMGLDILINKDKPSARDTLTPPMPNEAFATMKGILPCDTLEIANGALMYGERFKVGSKPAVITFDGLDVLAEGRANQAHRDTALVIRAKGKFMKAGMMTLMMSFPVPSPEFSLQYSGSLSSMNISALNAFLETAEQMRIKSGYLHGATFEINVALGRASGKVRAIYRDLTLAAINKQTGSEKGFIDGLVSYIANNYKIHGTNMPGKSDPIQIGKVKYVRQRDDPFFRFTWFALRSGVADVVGF